MKSRDSNPPFRIISWLGPVFLAALAVSSLPAANRYLVHNLVSDLPGLADQVDGQLTNPWDFDFPGQTLMIADSGSGGASLYTAIPAMVQQPVPVFLGKGTTGIMGFYFGSLVNAFNSTLFCTENGTIVALLNTTPQQSVTTLIDNSKSGAVYTGCTSGPFNSAYYATNFAAGRIEVWDPNLNPIQNPSAFIDPVIPPGFAPFNIQYIGNDFLVTYARRDNASSNDVPGPGNGYIASFDRNGNLLSTLVSQGPLNSPWGMIMANASFGDFANMLLVGNSGDGRINAFDPATGEWKGVVADAQGNPIAIPGLHALHFGAGFTVPFISYFGGGDPATLYFTAGVAGINGEPVGSHGLLGSIQPAPSFQTGSIQNGADFSTNLAPNTWVTILGGALSATTRSWNIADFTNQDLPINLDGVTVSINGEPAYISYISPPQINFLVPADLAPGPAQVVVTSNGVTSASISATLANAAPAFFLFSPNAPPDERFIAGLHGNNSPAMSLLPGETVALFATGLGATFPASPNGQLLTSPLPLIQPLQLTIGGQPAAATFAGLVGPGLYQVNVVVPPVEAKYRFFPVPVTMSVSGVTAQAAGFLAYDWEAIP